MKIKRVAQYQTSDGQTFADKKGAQAHQKELDRIDSLIGLFDGNAENYGGLTGTSENVRDFTIQFTYGDLAQFLVDSADELRAILPQRTKPVEDVEVVPLPAQTADDWLTKAAQSHQAGTATVQ